MTFLHLFSATQAPVCDLPTRVDAAWINYFVASRPDQFGKTIIHMEQATTLAVNEPINAVAERCPDFVAVKLHDAVGRSEVDHLDAYLNPSRVALIVPEEGTLGVRYGVRFADGNKIWLKELPAALA